MREKPQKSGFQGEEIGYFFLCVPFLQKKPGFGHWKLGREGNYSPLLQLFLIPCHPFSGGRTGKNKE